MPADSGEDSFWRGLRPPSCRVLTGPFLGACRQRASSGVWSSPSYKGPESLLRPPPYLNPVTAQRPHLQIPSDCGSELQHLPLGGQKHPAHDSGIHKVLCNRAPACSLAYQGPCLNSLCSKHTCKLSLAPEPLHIPFLLPGTLFSKLLLRKSWQNLWL